jgi:hypothetical protein
LQGPSKHFVPSQGVTCGRREREADASNELAVATVEGTLIHRVPVAFAGCRRNVGLGRSVTSAVGLVSCSGRTDDSGCPLELKRRGTSSACAKRTHSSCQNAQKALSTQEDTSFTQSRDPCSSIGTELLRRKPEGVSRSVRYRGRANLRKQEEPAPGLERTDEARLAAYHRCSRKTE